MRLRAAALSTRFLGAVFALSRCLRSLVFPLQLRLDLAYLGRDTFFFEFIPYKSHL